MIEINLIPDVKHELIRAQRVRNLIISISILVSIIAASVVVLMVFYVFAVQGLRGAIADKQIDDKFHTLKQVPDLDKALTLQNQLSTTSGIHDKVTMNSRMFDVLSTVVTGSDQQVTVTSFSVDADNKTVTIEGSAPQGYPGLDSFKKTILATKFQYQTTDNTDLQTVPLTTQIADGDRNYSEDSDGKTVLKFTLSFVYADALLSRDAINGKIIAPTVTNATDSASEVPSSLFTSGGTK